MIDPITLPIVNSVKEAEWLEAGLRKHLSPETIERMERKAEKMRDEMLEALEPKPIEFDGVKNFNDLVPNALDTLKNLLFS